MKKNNKKISQAKISINFGHHILNFFFFFASKKINCFKKQIKYQPNIDDMTQ
jgi:hypothetical protein